MTVMTGKLESIGGRPFGGPGHFVVIYSRVTRVAQQSDSVILPILDRFEMLSEDEGGDGTFVTTDMDPGPIRVELEGGDRDGERWDINLPEPEDGEQESWSLAQLIGLQVDWDPVVVSRAEAAARAANKSSVVSEEWATQVREDKEHIDSVVHEVMTDAAGMVRGEVQDLHDGAVAAHEGAVEEHAGARTERQGAEDAADSAHSAAGSAAADTTARVREEFDDKVAEAEGHAQSAGQSASATSADRVATGQDVVATGEDRTATGQDRAAVRMMLDDEATPIRTEILDARDVVRDELIPQISGYATAAAESRTGAETEHTGARTARTAAEAAQKAAEKAAENAQVGAPEGGWKKTDLEIPAQESLSRADTALQSLPSATEEARGGIRLAGDLSGTAEAPTVPKLTEKADKKSTEAALSGKAPAKHRHTWDDLDDVPGLATTQQVDALVQRVTALEQENTTLRELIQSRPAWFSGEGPPPTDFADTHPVYPGDNYIDELETEWYKFEEEA